MEIVNAVVLGIIVLALGSSFLEDIKKAVSEHNTDSQSGSEE